MTAPPELHRHAAAGGRSRLGFYVVTVSTSRFNRSKSGTAVTDESGDVAEERIRTAGHAIVQRKLIADERGPLRASLESGLADDGVDVVLFTGGTGISPTDITIETIRPSLEKELDGFGELLRSISYQKIGAAAALTRATAGVAKGKLVLCLPGSPDGVKTAMDAFLQEIPHVIFLARGA